MNDLNDFAVRLGHGEVAFAHAVARRYVPDPDDAADVAQEALMQAHRHRDSFRGTARHSTWLYRIVMTTAFSHLRRRKRRVARFADDADAAIESVDPAPTAESRLAAREAIDLAGAALDVLGERHRSVFRLRVHDGLSEQEVARRLGLTVATVKVRTHRARKVIQEQLADAA